MAIGQGQESVLRIATFKGQKIILASRRYRNAPGQGQEGDLSSYLPTAVFPVKKVPKEVNGFAMPLQKFHPSHS